MALEFRDRVADTTTTTGTGTVTLAGAAPAGFRAFTAHTTGATVRYSIATQDNAEWEVGEGVWTSSGATLTRVTVYASSNAGALVNFSAGTKTVTEVMVAESAGKVTHLLDKIRVRNATGGTSGSGSFQKVPFDTTEFDTGGIWNAANARIEPTKAGYYAVNVVLRYASTADITPAVKVTAGTTYIVGTPGGAGLSAGGSTLVYCNGSTDYIEAFAFASASVTWDTTTGFQYISAVGPL